MSGNHQPSAPHPHCHQLWDDITMSWTRIHWTIEAGQDTKIRIHATAARTANVFPIILLIIRAKVLRAPICEVYVRMCKCASVWIYLNIFMSFAHLQQLDWWQWQWVAEWMEKVGDGCLVSKAGHTRRDKLTGPNRTPQIQLQLSMYVCL